MRSLLLRGALCASTAACLLGAPFLHAATSTSFIDGTLSVSSDADDALVVDCNAGAVRLNGTPMSGPVACASVLQVEASGGPGANLIDLSGMLPNDFSNLLATEVIGAAGADTVIGSFAADVIIWNPGDGSDTNDGGAGNDRIVVNGSDSANTFTVGTAGVAPGFDLRFIGPFTIDIVGAEVLEINGRGGDDNISASALPAGLIALEITGGTGNDTIIGSAGDDTNIWNNGDNTDSFDGGAGDDLQIVNGAAAGDVFTVQAAAGAPIPNSVLFRRSNLIPFDVTLGNTEHLNINGLAGDDNIDASALPAGLIALQITGGTGNDTIIGSAGDDTNIWNNGDNTDSFDGGTGNDLQIVNGAGVGDNFTVQAAAGAPIANSVLFRRSNLIPFDVTLGNTERLHINGLAGDDNIDASALPAGLIALQITGGTGNDTIIGSAGDDTNIWNNGDNTDSFDGGAGSDLQIANGAAAGDVFTVQAAAGAPIANSVLFRRSNLIPFDVTLGNTERLQVNSLTGDDSIDASALPAGLINLELNGGEGNDAITGSAGDDLLRGGPGLDSLIGFLGNDQVFGNEGDDIMVWNPGDGTDLNDGGAGNDISRVQAAGAAETFAIAALTCTGSDPCVRVRRILPTQFDVDLVRVEQLELETGGGRDTVITEHLPGLRQLLDGGGPDLGGLGVDFFPVDALQVAGVTDARTSPVLRPGFGDIHHANFEFAPTMALAALGNLNGHTAQLGGNQEVPPVTTSATGRGSVVLSPDESQITVRLSFSGLSSNNTMSHIHGPALPGVNGPVIFNLGNSGSISGEFGPLTFAVTPQQVAQLKDGQWYFNVHSVNNPGGEVRGQVQPDQVFTADLAPQQIVGDTVVSQATGFGTVTLAGPQDSVVISLNYRGLTGEGAPGISTGVRLRGPEGRGENGPALADFPLRLSGTASDTFITQEYPITADEAQDLKDGLWYFEVQSGEFPEGELRGQVDNILFCAGFEANGC